MSMDRWMCMHACVHACMHAHLHACMHLCIHESHRQLCQLPSGKCIVPRPCSSPSSLNHPSSRTPSSSILVPRQDRCRGATCAASCVSPPRLSALRLFLAVDTPRTPRPPRAAPAPARLPRPLAIAKPAQKTSAIRASSGAGSRPRVPRRRFPATLPFCCPAGSATVFDL